MTTPHGAEPCPSCGQAVRWAYTAAGRRQAINPTSDPAGNLGAYTDGTGRLRVRVLTSERPTLEGAEWRAMPHAATCARPQPRRHTPTPRRTGVRPAPWRWTL
ncbi:MULTISPECIES: hypothetical protein [unclassified Streptomyces]|uniref:hypothetical protein n=1 Tax=unclassified Streptomyces TaxID=2593676 RepID=UPI001660B6D0|nr:MULTISPECIES: hypothetical protein [unclassified Streptomyces]MBD0707373.1 hypothetical protein [Streptomyces sp. CBMA291]MBD0715175.1 hypothetical protein [Streptomyces sp. CBMA370]